MTSTLAIHWDQVIPTVAGLLVFASILLAGGKNLAHRRAAWVLGGLASIGLVALGILQGTNGFWTYALAASAFAVNLIRSVQHKPDGPHRVMPDAARPRTTSVEPGPVPARS